MIEKILNSAALGRLSTEELKQEILDLTENRDTEPLNQKVLFHKNELAPLFEELSRRNPFPKPEEQVSLVLGSWSPVWSTIPFQDTLPGRLREQSYQIFLDNGYYGNIARYAPGSNLPFLQRLSSIFFAYDLIVLQRFEIINDRWHIQNVGIEQALRMSAIPLSIDKAEEWLTKVVKSKQKVSSDTDSPEAPSLENLDKSTVKKFKKVFLATPEFEHLYIDGDFRLVKSRREAKQRPSYTIVVRKR